MADGGGKNLVSKSIPSQDGSGCITWGLTDSIHLYRLDQLIFRVTGSKISLFVSWAAVSGDNVLCGSCHSAQLPIPPPFQKKSLRARPESWKPRDEFDNQANRKDGKLLAKRPFGKQKIPSYTNQPASQTSSEICVEEVIVDMRLGAVRGLGTGWDKRTAHAVSWINCTVVYKAVSNSPIYIQPDFSVIEEINRSKKVLVFTQAC